MGNVFVTVGHDIKVVAKDTVHGIEDVITVGEKVIKVVTSLKPLAPEFKSELSTLITDLKPIAAALAPLIAEGGENTAADLAAVAPVLSSMKKLAQDFFAFLPTLESAYETVQADVTT